MKNFKKIVGEKCYLSPVSLENAEKYVEWLNDLEVTYYLGTTSTILSLFKEKEFLENLCKQGDPIFGIVDAKTGELIGGCGLHQINQINRTAEFGIFIGDKNYWGKGFGEEATRLVLDFGFNILNLRNIFLNVFDYNKRGIKCYEKVGFKEAGRRRKSRLIGGKEFDIIIMDILNEEFESPYLMKILKS